MFDFEKLIVYQKAKLLNKSILKLTKNNLYIHPYMRNQLQRAALSVVINIAEGSGRVSTTDKKNFFTIARGSAMECISILEIIEDENIITEEKYIEFYSQIEELSKMLFSISRNLTVHQK